MRKHIIKLLAPIVVTVLLIVYFVFFMLMWVSDPLPAAVKVIGIIVPLALIGVSIFVLVERIKEIRSGDEDDLSKY